MQMRTFPAVVAWALAAACSSNPWTSQEAEAVDRRLLTHLDDEQREAISEARAENMRLADELAAARRRLQEAENDQEIAEEELDMAEAEVEKAETRVEGAKERTGEDLDEAHRLHEEARSYLHLAETRISLHEARVEAAKKEVALAEAKLALAEAEIELSKAEAVKGLDRPEVAGVDVEAHRRAVDRRGMALADAEAEAEAARKKVEHREGLVEERVEAVPARYRADRDEEEKETEKEER